MKVKLAHNFRKLTEVLEENSLSYFVIGGTLLGAIRHKGFIPWDDDIDILMPRKDYLELMSIVNKGLMGNNFKFVTKENNSNDIFLSAKLVDVNTTLVENFRNSRIITGVFIDIFVMDMVNYPDKKVDKLFKKISVFNYLRIIKGNNKIYSQLKKIISFFLYPFVKLFFNEEKFFSDIQHEIYKVSVENGEYYATFFGAREKKKEIRKSEWFKDYVYVEFEHFKVRAPLNFHEVLVHAYGDYMRLPPLEFQKSHHSFTYINLDLPYEEYKQGEK